MPIKPENAHRYPADWPQIRARILERAGNCCEGSPAFPDCRARNYSWRHRLTGELYGSIDEAPSANDAGELRRFVLTIGHLDHMPENCADENLRAWCQRCHLAYDLREHMQNAYQSRRAGRAAGDLFEDK